MRQYFRCKINIFTRSNAARTNKCHATTLQLSIRAIEILLFIMSTIRESYVTRIYHVGDRQYVCKPTILQEFNTLLNASVIKSKLFKGHPREREREQGKTLTSIRLLEARPSLPSSRRVCSPIRASRLCISRYPNSRPACKEGTNRQPCCDVLWFPRRPFAPNEILVATDRPSCAAKKLLGSVKNRIVSHNARMFYLTLNRYVNS